MQDLILKEIYFPYLLAYSGLRENGKYLVRQFSPWLSLNSEYVGTYLRDFGVLSLGLVLILYAFSMLLQYYWMRSNPERKLCIWTYLVLFRPIYIFFTFFEYTSEGRVIVIFFVRIKHYQRVLKSEHHSQIFLLIFLLFPGLKFLCDVPGE